MNRYKKLIHTKQIVFTTFHQSLDYEEFVEGLKPEIDEVNGKMTYQVKNGIFKNICNKATLKKCSVEQQNTTVQNNNSNEPKYYDLIRQAWSGEKLTDEHKNYPIDKVVEFIKNEILFEKGKKNNSQPHILIIDEINRGNISKIFGELITLLEKDKRLGEENEITVTLPYSQETFGVPSNLYIIGTMNTADRSIGHIDYAIRRRFSFLSLKSDKNVISSYDKYDTVVKEKAESLFDKIKDFISNNINPDLDADDLMIGHSYFLCETADDLKIRLEYEIIPLVEEYEKDGIIMLNKSEMRTEFEEWRKQT